jgi:molybdopterin synthase catalytic subunit
VSVSIEIRVQPQDFDLSTELERMRLHNPQIGAIASFVGVVRDCSENRQLACMELEHYPGMTEKSIRQIIDEACRRWPLLGATVIHRVGKLAPTEQIVMVAVSACHRAEAFAACEFIMDYLKTSAPFWKKELTGHEGRWVDARDSDQAAAQRWSRS